MIVNPSSRLSKVAFTLALILGFLYVVFHLREDAVGFASPSLFPFAMLGLALLIALGFEFVNGFHDTANAVATVIYSNSLPPVVAVIWSGVWNFIGVIVSNGAVAFTIVSLLPVELVLRVGSEAGFSMVFSLLLAAVIWNLATWYFGIPNSSSHTLIGSIIGVGLMNQVLIGHGSSSGVDWGQALQVFKALVFSPLAGFFIASLGMFLLKSTVSIPLLYQAPEGNKPPPILMRLLLILTCTGVSFSHGSNDGQKGMGLIMLILIGTVPTVYALNGAITPSEVESFHHRAMAIEKILDQKKPLSDQLSLAQSRAVLTKTIQQNQLFPDTIPAMRQVIGQVDQDIRDRRNFHEIPQDKQTNVRNNLYLLNETLTHFVRNAPLSRKEKKDIGDFQSSIMHAIQFIPPWVKVVVALALGLGTMVGWKRVVETVGSRIGKKSMSYGQGAVAEMVAMTMIQMGNEFHMPISTTHVVTSAVAGTALANGNGIQWRTVRNMAMAWVLTLPMAIVLSGSFFWLFLKLF